MIDTTDKYEGHTEGEWILLGDDEQGYGVKTPKHDDPMAFIERRNDDGEIVSLSKADAVLIADAPLLLAEVKRLREENEGLIAIWNHLASPYDCESHELVEILEKYGFMEASE